jgi:alkylhydroperoxidase family enzyme
MCEPMSGFYDGQWEYIKDWIHRLIELQESRTGKPRNHHELRFLLQWIHEECKLRWPNVSKRDVWNTVKEIDGYDFEMDKELLN